MADLGDAYDYSTKTNAEREIEGSVLDWSKLSYQCYYISYEFYESQFPQGFGNLPGFELIFDGLVQKNEQHTPLAEYNLRTNIKDNE